MTNVIRRIRAIIGKDMSSIIAIRIYSDNEIEFKIYESEIPIILDINKGNSYLDCGCTDVKIDCIMLEELSKICSMLQKNIVEIKEALN